MIITGRSTKPGAPPLPAHRTSNHQQATLASMRETNPNYRPGARKSHGAAGRRFARRRAAGFLPAKRRR